MTNSLFGDENDLKKRVNLITHENVKDNEQMNNGKDTKISNGNNDSNLSDLEKMIKEKEG